MNSTTYDEFVTDLLLILLTSIFFLVIKFKLERQRISKKANNHHPLPPGPKPWPIIGCLPQMLKNKPVFKWIHSIMKEMNVEIACIRLGNTHVIPVTCPKIACEFIKTNDAIMASRPYSFSTELVSMGYLSTALVPFGEQWKKMRKLLVKHLISSEKHKWQHDKRIEEADHLVRYVFKQCMEKGGLVNVRLASQHYAGNVTRKLVFNKRYFGEGGKDGGPGLEEEEHVDAVFTILEYIFAFCVSDYLPCLKGLDLDGHEKVVNRAIEIIRKFHDPIIEERIQSWNDGTKTQIEDMLDAMITAKDDHGNRLLCLEEIKAQTSELMIEIMDNPPNIAEWTLAEMLNQPQILEKAVEELDRVVGKERLVQESDFSQLNYIKACLRESMRLHPLYPFDVPHVSTANTVVSNYFIPKGSHVLLSRLGLGRNPKIWNEPLEFRPERHLKNDGSEVVLTENELRFISFGTGRRGCPGVNLGTSMAVMLLARLVHGFTWSVPSRIHLIEAEDKLVLAKPLHALAKPRLAPHLYPA